MHKLVCSRELLPYILVLTLLSLRFHLACLIQGGGEILSSEQEVVCEEHKTDMLDEKLRLCQWPEQTKVCYINSSDWSAVPKAIQDMLKEHVDKWQNFKPRWLVEDLETQTYINRIYPGHWAWSQELYQFQRRALCITQVKVFLLLTALLRDS